MVKEAVTGEEGGFIFSNAKKGVNREGTKGIDQVRNRKLP